MPESTLAGPTLADFQEARERVSAVVHATPMENSSSLSELLGSTVYLKCENLQRTGSYKIRGAYNRLALLSPQEKALGVVAASAGNHAQGVAFAARELGIRSTIFMPMGAALPKLQATRHYGAEVVLHGNDVAEALEAAIGHAERTGAVFIHPYDHLDIITGQGTLGLDIYDERPDLDTVVVPIGGGGLISGVASAIKQRAALDGRTVRVVGVQAANAASYPPSLALGEPTEIVTLPTIADGILVSKPGVLNFEIVRDTGRRDPHGERRRDRAGAASRCSSAPSSWWNPPVPSESRRSSPVGCTTRARPSCCSPAATSTR